MASLKQTPGEFSKDLVPSDAPLPDTGSSDEGNNVTEGTKRKKVSPVRDSNKTQAKSSSTLNGNRSKRLRPNRNSAAERIVMDRLFGGDGSASKFYILIVDDDPTEKFSAQPISMRELLIQQVLNIDPREHRYDDMFKMFKFKKRSSEHYTVEVCFESETHISKVLKLNKIGDFKVKISENLSKNCVKGTFRDFKDDFEGLADDAILEYMGRHGVKNLTEVKRLGKSKTISVSFRGQVLPTEINLQVLQTIKLRKFIPKPPRCFKCQSYDHSTFGCRNNRICYRCGIEFSNEEHIPKDCTLKANCCHCNKEHMAGSRDCEKEKLEMKWQQIMSDKGLSRREVKDQFPDGKVRSFADSLGKPGTDHLPIDSRRDTIASLPQYKQGSSEHLERQNAELQRRVNNLEEALKAKSQVNQSPKPANTAESSKDEPLDETLASKYEKQQKQIDFLLQKQAVSEKKFSDLYVELEKKDKVINDQISVIESLNTVINSQKVKLEALAESTSRDLYDSNTTLVSTNQKLEAERKQLSEQFNKLKDKSFGINV